MRRNSVRIQDRDRRIVRDVFLHRVVRRDDLVRLGHFCSVARCNDRLSQLVSAGWLRRITTANGLAVQQALYGPGPSSAAALSRDLETPLEEILSVCADREGPLLLEHSLRILDFRHCLNRECQELGVRLGDWLCEPECLHEFEFRPSPYAAWKSVVIKPDASFSLPHACGSTRFFFEADLGHVSLPRFLDKLNRYNSYLDSGAFRDAYSSEGFNVVTVTVGERRLLHLAELPCSGFSHLLTTWSRIEANGIFNGTWTTRQHLNLRLVDMLNSESEGVRQ